MGVPLGNRPAVPRDWFRGVPERYVAGADIRGRPEGRPYPGSQQAIHEKSGLDKRCGTHYHRDKPRSSKKNATISHLRLSETMYLAVGFR